MKSFIIDSSTSLKWVLKDEENYKKAQKILLDYLEGRITLLAPNLWVYEVANGLKSALLTSRISYQKAKKLLGLLLEVKPHLIPMEPVIKICLENSYKYGISIYDSSYLTLAREHNLTFISGDKKLISKINDHKLAIFLEEYLFLTPS